MGVVKEYVCMAHGAFESSVEPPLCPMGCDTVERAFFTPPSLRGDRTKATDKILESLAKNYGLTDMNNRGGQAVAGRLTLSQQRAQRQAEAAAEYIREKYGTTGWGDVAPGGTLNVKEGKVESVPGRNGAGIPGVFGTYGGHADNALAEVAEAGALVPKPITKHIVRDTPDVSTVSPPA